MGSHTGRGALDEDDERKKWPGKYLWQQVLPMKRNTGTGMKVEPGTLKTMEND